MSRKVLVAEISKCIGCRICEQWCSLMHYGVISPVKSKIKVTRWEEKGVDIQVVCTQCKNAPCVNACPEDALSVNPGTGAVEVDVEKCTACRICVSACPHGAISIHPDGEYPLICNLCEGNPKCVEVCPAGALQYVPIEISERLHKNCLINKCVKGGTVL